MSLSKPVLPTLIIGSVLLTTAVSPSTALAGSSFERARVVGVDPVYQTVAYQVPVEQCSLVEVPVTGNGGYDDHRYRSYTGPILGAIIGGAIGNAVGHKKTNKKVGTAVGAVLGGTIGRDIQRRHEAQRYGRYQTVAYRSEEVCETVYETEERQELLGYDVTWRYNDRTHTTRMDRDPGRYLDVRVEVTPV